MVGDGAQTPLAEADLQKRADQLGALQVDAQQQEAPALAVAHGGVGGALEQVQVGDGVVQEGLAAVGEGARRLGVGHTQVDEVQPLPGLAGDLVAHLPGVFPGAGQRARHRARVFAVQHQGARGLVGVERLGRVLGVAHGGERDTGDLGGRFCAV